MARRTGTTAAGSGGNRRRQARYARNSSDAAQRQQAANSGRSRRGGLSAEDAETMRHPRKERIRDVGQKPPKGYVRQLGSRYFVQDKYIRPIKSQTTEAQRAMYWANQRKFHANAAGNGGFFRSAGNQGMWGADGIMNFRKTTAARKLIDSDGGTYPEGYGTAGRRTRGASKYTMAFGQDGHVR